VIGHFVAFGFSNKKDLANRFKTVGQTQVQEDKKVL